MNDKNSSDSSSSSSTSFPPGWERDVLERLLFASVREQRAARRWRLLTRIGWFIAFALAAWWIVGRESGSSSASEPHTAVVEIRGEIASGASASAELINSAVRAAFEDSGSRAVVLLINSPGGSPVQAGMINDEISRLKSIYDKPVYAVVEESCASAAYYIAAAADEIFVDKASIVGSIGVLMDSFGFEEAMKKLGVERRLLTAGSDKGMLDPFSPMSQGQREHAQAMLDQIHRQFIDVVQRGRGERLSTSQELFSGLFWTGEQAVALGLADRLASLDTVARDIVQAEEIIDYTRRDNVAERLAKRFGASMGQALGTSLLGTSLGQETWTTLSRSLR